MFVLFIHLLLSFLPVNRQQTEEDEEDEEDEHADDHGDHRLPGHGAGLAHRLGLRPAVACHLVSLSELLWCCLSPGRLVWCDP